MSELLKPPDPSVPEWLSDTPGGGGSTPPPPGPDRRGKRERRGGFQPMLLAVTLLSVAALGISVMALWLSAPRHAVSSPDPAMSGPGSGMGYQPPTITFGTREIPIREDVDRNLYDTACFAVSEEGRVTYEKHGKQAMTGIDVSVYQGEIDWQKVKEAGIEFAMIRVGFRGYGSRGVIVEDTYFKQNMEGALEAGLQVGVYFFSQAINVWEAEEEASYVLDAIRNYDVTFPVVFDWEPIHSDTARTDGLSAEALTRCAGAFCDAVAQGGHTPMIYFNQNQGYLTYDLSKLKDYGFWLAEYNDAPGFYYHFDLWQYSSKGSVPGIQGDVDLNLSFVDYGSK